MPQKFNAGLDVAIAHAEKQLAQLAERDPMMGITTHCPGRKVMSCTSLLLTVWHHCKKPQTVGMAHISGKKRLEPPCLLTHQIRKRAKSGVSGQVELGTGLW